MSKIFALADCNNFYASCEKVFNPVLRDLPVVVLSNNDGCIVARSKEAKKLGIPMGTPVFKMKDIIEKNNVQIFSSNYTLYGDMSRRVMETLAGLVYDLEIYSIDEAFLDLSGMKNLDKYARYIRFTVKQWTGITMSIGIGSTKTLAKIANHIAKKSTKADGVLNLYDSSHLDRALEITEVGNVWGIGSRYAEWLRRKGINNALELRNVDDSWIKRKMGIVGVRLVHELRGKSCYDLDLNPAPNKGITCSRSFGRPVVEYKDLEEAVANYAFRASEKLRAQKLAANVVSVFVMTNRFKDEPQYFNLRDIKLPVSSDDVREIVSYSIEVLKKIYKKGFRYKKAGIMLSDLVPADPVQMNMYDEIDRAKSKRLMKVIDQINCMGTHKLSLAIQGIERSWKTRLEMRSPHYTTDWRDIISINI